MKESISRRSFIRSSAAMGAGMLLSPKAFAAGAASKNTDAINIGLIGYGAEGQVLSDAVLKISHLQPVHFKAVCDIWEPNRLRGSNTLGRAYKHLGHSATPYIDFEDMLEKEDLDCVIVATPDFWHARHTIASLKKGLHVYCEKEMSNSLVDAKAMVLTARAEEKLLQIGHQRRSNPKYRFCYDKMIKENEVCGRMTTVNGQWNRARSACEDIGCAASKEIDPAILKKYGFKDMHQFLNWRWFKGLGGGPIVDLGSHQIDIYSWFLEAQPKSVMASGGVDYWPGHEWYDTVTCLLEYETKYGMVRASYRTLTTNSNGGYFEQFMGDRATLDISESGRSAVYREVWVPQEEWYPMESERLIKRDQGMPVAQDTPAVLDARSSPKPPKYNLLVDMNLPFHQPHLENFFNSIRGTDTLNCPGEIGYETAVAVLKVNEAVEAGKKLEFKPEDFHV